MVRHRKTLLFLQGEAHDPNPAGQIRLNINGIIAVCDAAASTGTDVIFISSKSVYGKLQPAASSCILLLREDHLKATIALYGSTKLVCEPMLEGLPQCRKTRLCRSALCDIMGTRQGGPLCKTSATVRSCRRDRAAPASHGEALQVQSPGR